MFNTQNAQQAPWRQAGQNALATIMPGGGTDASGNPLPGSTVDPQFTHQFNASDLNSNLAPNYQFQLDQGLGATKNAANLQTGLVSGNAMKGVNDYAQNFAGNAYQNAFNNYNANQTNIFNRLSSIAGYGQTANQTSAGLAGQLAPSVANTQVGAGQAQAAGITGMGNAAASGINNAAGWYSLPQIMNSGNSTSGGSSSNFTQAAASDPTNSYLYQTGSLGD